MGTCVSDQGSNPYKGYSMRGRYHAGGKIQFKRKAKENQIPMKNLQTF